MSKKNLTIEQVREARAQGTAFVFNLETALAGAEKVSAKAPRSGNLGDMNIQLIQIFTGAGKPLALNQVASAFEACGASVDAKFKKQISDKCWGLAKKGILTKLGGGMYEIASKNDGSDASEDETEGSDAE